MLKQGTSLNLSVNVHIKRKHPYSHFESSVRKGNLNIPLVNETSTTSLDGLLEVNLQVGYKYLLCSHRYSYCL